MLFRIWVENSTQNSIIPTLQEKQHVCSISTFTSLKSVLKAHTRYAPVNAQIITDRIWKEKG